MKKVGAGDSLHTVFMNAGILCIRCRTCDKRNAIDMGSRNDRTKLSKLKFKCKRCGGHDVELFIPTDYSEAMTFLKEIE